MSQPTTTLSSIHSHRSESTIQPASTAELTSTFHNTTPVQSPSISSISANVTPADHESVRSSLSEPMIGIIVVGCVAFILAIFAGILCLARFYYRQRNVARNRPPSTKSWDRASNTDAFATRQVATSPSKTGTPGTNQTDRSLLRGFRDTGLSSPSGNNAIGLGIYLEEDRFGDDMTSSRSIRTRRMKSVRFRRSMEWNLNCLDITRTPSITDWADFTRRGFY